MTIEKKAIDWEKIELDYRAGVKTLRQIADEHDISHVSINKRAKRDDWVRDLSAKIKAEKVILRKNDPLDRSGFVYVIYLNDSNDKKYYKIGMSGSFTSRFEAHQCASPFDICVACAYFVGNMRHEETDLHRIFADKRIRGEWFELDDDDLKQIAARSLLI